MDAGRKEGCDVVVVEASAYKSQAMYEKMGFQNMNTIPYAELLDEK